MVTTSKSFTEVESEYFQAIFRCIPGIKPLSKSTKTATTRILESTWQKSLELKSELATTEIAVSVSIDGWTSKGPMFDIVVHWITEEWEEWEAREAVLHIAELGGKHTGVALAHVLRFSATTGT
ncbi:hypothetical protein V1508DRAFT_426592 [Lipomyces doorenjongii]|uniref:uncharacterized protein n=1 Tax=Lipomyces doorenjongii TaxID=383834 RepID=UPI0034CF89BB